MICLQYRHKEKGSVLILILVAVSLFAALSFTVAQMMRSGNAEAVSERQARIFGDEILAIAHQYRQAVQTMRISNGCAVEDISFETSALTGYAHTPAVADTCKLFDPDGGGVSYIAPSGDWLDTTQSAQTGYGEIYFTGETCVVDVGTGGVNCNSSADDEELLMMVPYVLREVCEQINNHVNVDNVSDAPPQISGNAVNYSTNKFTGTFGNAYEIDKAEFRGKLAGCFEGTGAFTPAGTYHFYQVLVAR